MTSTADEMEDVTGVEALSVTVAQYHSVDDGERLLNVAGDAVKPLCELTDAELDEHELVKLL